MTMMRTLWQSCRVIGAQQCLSSGMQMMCGLLLVALYCDRDQQPARQPLVISTGLLNLVNLRCCCHAADISRLVSVSSRKQEMPCS